jgi:large subunit ribosomal protein L5
MATPRLKEKYLKEIVPGLKQKFQYKSVMQVPKIEKICINKGIGAAGPIKSWWTWALKS